MSEEQPGTWFFVEGWCLGWCSDHLFTAYLENRGRRWFVERAGWN